MHIINTAHCPVCYGSVSCTQQNQFSLRQIMSSARIAKLRKTYQETRTCPLCGQTLGIAFGPIAEACTDLGKIL
mgnify:CR=1 FL=1